MGKGWVEEEQGKATCVLRSHRSTPAVSTGGWEIMHAQETMGALRPCVWTRFVRGDAIKACSAETAGGKRLKGKFCVEGDHHGDCTLKEQKLCGEH